MKLNKLVLLLSMAAMGVSVAQAAAPTAELKVKGVISPGSCTVNAPDNGEYDFGRISAEKIKTTAYYTDLNPQEKKWVITCDADTALTFKVVDNRSATTVMPTAGLTNVFGLGAVNGTGKIGGYGLNMLQSTVDGKNTLTFATKDNTINEGVMTVVSIDHTMGWSLQNSLATGKVFATSLEVQPYLGKVSDMNGPVTSDVNLDGSLTLNFAYGI